MTLPLKGFLVTSAGTFAGRRGFFTFRADGAEREEAVDLANGFGKSRVIEGNTYLATGSFMKDFIAITAIKTSPEIFSMRHYHRS